MTLLADRTVLVVGAAGGIGAAIVTACRLAGARVLCADLPDAAMAEADGPACAVDLKDVDDATARLTAFAAEHGPLDGIVNAAGISGRGRFPDVSTAEWRRVLDVDLVAPAQLVQALAPHLRTPGASVVNVTSIEGDAVYASAGSTGAPYAASKAGLQLATRCLAVDLGRLGVRVNAVAPGFIRTAMSAGAMERVGPWLEDQTALGRVGEPADLGGPTVFLLSDAAAYVTGHTLVVDGGMSLGLIYRGG